MKKWYIYKITSPSGKIYIGKTYSMKKRMRHYKYGDYKGQTRLYSSLIKYGYDSHEIKVLDEFDGTGEFAAGKEMFWIRSFMCNYCKYPEIDGLNLTDGGEGTIGYKMSEDNKKKLSERVKANPIRYWKGVKFSEERRKQMSEISKRCNTKYWLGKKRSEETKKKMVENRRAKGGYVQSDEQKEKRAAKLRGRLRPDLKGKSPMLGKKLSSESIAKMVATKKKNNALLTKEERNKKFGSCHIGNTYNKGRKPSQLALDNSVKARKLKALKKQTTE